MALMSRLNRHAAIPRNDSAISHTQSRKSVVSPLTTILNVEYHSMAYLERHDPDILAFRDGGLHRPSSVPELVHQSEEAASDFSKLESSLDSAIHLLAKPHCDLDIAPQSAYKTEHQTLLENELICRRFQSEISKMTSPAKVAYQQTQSRVHETVIDHAWSIVKRDKRSDDAFLIFHSINEVLKWMRYDSHTEPEGLVRGAKLISKLEKAVDLLANKFKDQLDFESKYPTCTTRISVISSPIEFMFFLNFQRAIPQMLAKYSGVEVSLPARKVSLSLDASFLAASTPVKPASMGVSPAPFSPSFVLSPDDSSEIPDSSVEVLREADAPWVTVDEQLWSLNFQPRTRTMPQGNPGDYSWTLSTFEHSALSNPVDFSGSFSVTDSRSFSINPQTLNDSIAHYFSPTPVRRLPSPPPRPAAAGMAGPVGAVACPLLAKSTLVGVFESRFGKKPVLTSLTQADGTVFVGPVKELDDDEFLVGELHNSEGKVIARGFFLKDSRNKATLMNGVMLDPISGQITETVNREIDSVSWVAKDISMNSLTSFEFHEAMVALDSDDEPQAAATASVLRVVDVAPLDSGNPTTPTDLSRSTLSSPAISPELPGSPVKTGPVFERLSSKEESPKGIVLGQKMEGDRIVEKGLYEFKNGEWKLLAGHRKQPDRSIKPWNPLLSKIGPLPRITEHWNGVLRRANGLPEQDPKQSGAKSRVVFGRNSQSSPPPATATAEQRSLRPIAAAAAAKQPHAGILKKPLIATQFDLTAVTTFRPSLNTAPINGVVCGEIHHGAVVIAKGLFKQEGKHLHLLLGHSKLKNEWKEVRDASVSTEIACPNRVTGKWASAHRSLGTFQTSEV